MATYELDHLQSKHMATDQLPRWACFVTLHFIWLVLLSLFEATWQDFRMQLWSSRWEWSELFWAAWASTVGWLKISKTRMTGSLALLGWCFKWVSEFLVTWLGAVPCLQITLLVTEGTAGRDGSDQHGPDVFFTWMYNVGLQNWSHSFIEVKIQQLHWLHMPQPLQREQQPFGWSSCLNYFDVAFGAEVQLCKQQTEQRWSRQLKSSAVRAVRSISSGPWPSWQKPVGDASGRPVKACLLWWWRALRPSQWWTSADWFPQEALKAQAHHFPEYQTRRKCCHRSYMKRRKRAVWKQFQSFNMTKATRAFEFSWLCSLLEEMSRLNMAGWKSTDPWRQK